MIGIGIPGLSTGYLAIRSRHSVSRGTGVSLKMFAVSRSRLTTDLQSNPLYSLRLELKATGYRWNL